MCCVATRCLQSTLVVVRKTVLGLAEAPSLLLADGSQPIQTWVLFVWHNAIGSWCCFNLGDAVAGPLDSVSYGGFRPVYGKSALSSLVLAVFYHA